MNTAVDRIVTTFETLTPEKVALLDVIYAPNAHFKDPFNAVHGLPEIQRIFSHMYVSLNHPRFVVTGRVVQGRACFLTWEFHFSFLHFKQNQPQCIVGGSHLLLGEDGRITQHRDYWDAAEELYEKLPLIGNLMRWLKRRSQS
jgi:steroid Delta-isomerase